MFDIFSNNPLSKLSLEELKSREKSAQTLVKWSIGFFIVMVVFFFIWSFMKGYSTTNVIFLVGLSFFIAITTAKLKEIRVEISSRV